MMPRPSLPLRLRVLAGALALWLAPELLDAPALHACPMHDAVPAPPTQASPAMAGMPGMAGGALAVAEGGTAGQHAHDAHVHGCTCLGACALGGVVLAPSGAGVAPSAPITLSAAVRGAPLLLARVAGAHFLPFAQAPPLPS